MVQPERPSWFQYESIGNGITLVREPHVIPFLRCNIWHVRGRDHDLMIDTGMGICNLYEASRHLFGQRVVAIATHAHLDHVGSHHEFDECWAHPLEADAIQTVDPARTLFDAGFDPVHFTSDYPGYEYSGPIITELPSPDFRLEEWELKPATVTRRLEQGDVIDLGDRHFEILHLPGHSPGSIGLWDKSSAVLFSGDAIYDGPLIDTLEHSDQAAYIKTMERLCDLPVEVVHAGHDESFSRQRLRVLARGYLDRVNRAGPGIQAPSALPQLR